jgi:O-antigen ligase
MHRRTPPISRFEDSHHEAGFSSVTAILLGSLFGAFTALGIVIGIPLFTGIVTLLFFVALALTIAKSKLYSTKSSTIFIAIFAAYMLSICLSVAASGIFYRTTLIPILKISVIPLMGFLITFLNANQGKVLYYWYLLTFGTVNLFFYSKFFFISSSVDLANRIVLNPYTSTEVRATGAAETVFSLVLVGFMYFEFKGILYKLLSACSILSAITFSIFIGTRGLVFATVPFFAIYIFLNSTNLRKNILPIIFLTATTIGAVLVFGSSETIRTVIIERILTRFEVNAIIDSPGSGRLDIWIMSAQDALSSFFGKGYVYTDDILGFSTHNTYLELWISFGILSLLSFAFLVLFSLKVALRNFLYARKRSLPSTGKELAVLAILTYFMVESHLYSIVGVYTFFFLIMGLVIRESSDIDSRQRRLS